MTLEQDIRDILNKHSRENISDTSDFILAKFLMECLAAFEAAQQRREKWYGRGEDGEQS